MLVNGSSFFILRGQTSGIQYPGLQGVVREGHHLVILNTVQDPFLSDAVLAPRPLAAPLPHQYPGCPRPWTEVTSPGHNQLSQVRTGGPALVTDVHTADI